MARLSGRTYVFADVVWDPNTDQPYVSMPDESDRNHLAHGAKYRAAKLPLRAFINAPTSGSPWPSDAVYQGNPSLISAKGNSTPPRAVSDKWYERYCPEERRFLVDTKKVNSEMGIDLGHAEGIDIVHKWGDYLKTLDEHPCVEIIKGSDRLIDWECVSFTSFFS